MTSPSSPSAETPAAFVDRKGNLSVPKGSPLAAMLKALPDAPFGEEVLPLFVAPTQIRAGETLARLDWVDCPVCHEPDMRMETDADGNSLIHCVNHGCPSNNIPPPLHRFTKAPVPAALSPKPGETIGEALDDLLTKLWFVAGKLNPEPREDIASIIVALRARLSAPPKGNTEGVKVKPLEWEPNSPQTPNSLWVNVPAINRHYTIDPESNVFCVETQLSLSEYGPEKLGLHPTLDAAKAAAQRDFETRILSALTPSPISGEATKALEAIRDYPNGRRATEDGYPMEVAYDEWAYRRMVDNYREAAKAGLAAQPTMQPGDGK